MMTGNHQLKKDGTITSRGIDYGGKVTLVFRAGGLIVTHGKGSMEWDGVGSPSRYFTSEM